MGNRQIYSNSQKFSKGDVHAWVLPVEVENNVEDLRVSIEKELVALENVVIAQVQLLAVVHVCSQPANPCFGILGSQPVG